MNTPQTRIHPSILPILALVALPVSLDAATLTLNPTDDSYIRPGFANQGSNLQLLVGDTATSSDFIRSALAFDLNDPVLTSALSINSVVLNLVVNNTDGSSGNVVSTINLHQLSASFTNSGVTWTSRNGTDNWTAAGGDFGAVLDSETANASTVTPGDIIQFASTGLTNAGANAVGGSIYLLAKLEVEDANRSVFFFGSQNNGTAARRPTLTIDYTPVPEPSLFSLLGIFGFAAMGIRRRA